MSITYSIESDCGARAGGASSSRRCLSVIVKSATAVAATLVAGCATAAPYNPKDLEAVQLDRVSQICQVAMGLSPSEPPSGVWGAAQDPHLDPGENHYEGCIASLSESLQSMNSRQALAGADANCRAQGYGQDTPGLAECVLNSQGQRRASAGVADQAAYARPSAAGLVGVKANSFYTARPHEVSLRERQACAQLGLNPLYGAFDNCVSNMDWTFYWIDNPHN